MNHLRAACITFVVGCLSPAMLVAADASPRHVLILGIDGCRPDALAVADAPHLAALIRDGAFTARAQTGEQTVSGPGWSSMLTGVWPTKHGVTNNFFFGSHYEQFPHLFQRVKDFDADWYTASVVHWAPIHHKIVAAADHSTAPGNDDQVADEACRLLREQDPRVLFLHFDDVDAAGHGSGFHPSVPEYVTAIEAVDRRIGRVLAALRDRESYADEAWLTLVCTDHGGQGRSHSGGAEIPEIRTIFFLAHGPGVEQGTIEQPVHVVDVAATALAYLGSPIDSAWQFDGRPIALKSVTAEQGSAP